MTLFRKLRMATGLAIGVFITLAVSLFTFIFRYRDGPGLWGRLTRKWSHGVFAQIEYDVHGDIKPIDDDEIVVIFGNHQSTAALSEFSYYLAMHLGRTPVFIVKNDLYPWILWPIDRIGIAIVIDRNNPKAAVKAIQEAIPQVIAKKQAILIFAEGSRWTPQRARDQRTDHEDVNGAHETLEHILLPKSGGLSMILRVVKKAAQGKKVRVIRTANGFDVRLESLPDALRLSGATYHVFPEEIDFNSIPKDRAEFKTWLNGQYLDMSRQLASVRNSPSQIVEISQDASSTKKDTTQKARASVL